MAPRLAHHAVAHADRQAALQKSCDDGGVFLVLPAILAIGAAIVLRSMEDRRPDGIARLRRGLLLVFGALAVYVIAYIWFSFDLLEDTNQFEPGPWLLGCGVLAALGVGLLASGIAQRYQTRDGAVSS